MNRSVGDTTIQQFKDFFGESVADELMSRAKKISFNPTIDLVFALGIGALIEEMNYLKQDIERLKLEIHNGK